MAVRVTEVWNEITVTGTGTATRVTEVYTEVVVQSASIDVFKIQAYALVGPPLDKPAISKIQVYAIMAPISTIIGTASLTDGSDTIVASGVLTPITYGAASLTDADDTVVSTLLRGIEGAASLSDDADTLAAIAGVLSTGSIAASEDSDTIVATATLTTHGVLAITEASDSVTSGALVLSGSNGFSGPPTTIFDPTVDKWSFDFEDIHGAALLLRTAIWMEKSASGDSEVNLALMSKAWAYLESRWQTSGEMANIWSGNPAGRRLYAYELGEVIETLAQMVKNQSQIILSGIPVDLVKTRLQQAALWIDKNGQRLTEYSFPNDPTLGTFSYRGYEVFTLEPDSTETLTIEYERISEELDNGRSIIMRQDSAGIPFLTQKYSWLLVGRQQRQVFYNLLYAMSGRKTPVWLPSFTEDFVLATDIAAGTKTLTVERVGFDKTGGEDKQRNHIAIFLQDGGVFYRQIVNTADGDNVETLYLDRALHLSIEAKDVARISLMRLARLDTDTVEIRHLTDIEGASTCAVTFKHVPDLRYV